MEKHPLHLKIPELQTSPEVQDAVKKQERITEEKIPNDPGSRIEAYMDRLEKIFLNPDERVRERNLEMLRDDIYDVFIIKPDEVPESYFELQQQVARERGQPVEHIPQDVRDQMVETIINDQKHSLDNWIDYLTSEDATYPTWFKYFVFRNVIKLSQFDKSLGKFKDRTDTTVAPYPDVYREPLAQICDIYEQVAGDNKKLRDPLIQEEFSKKFPKLYAELITKSLAASMEGKDEVNGEWIKYEQGDEAGAIELYESLEGKGTGWCTAGKSTAETQIESGDFYVYYTYDKNGVPVQPRIAIRMNGQNEIGEVRGIQQHQSLEPQMNDILEKKLSEFGPEADKYKKKNENMRRLTAIEKKTKANQDLSKEELAFLYEMDSQIEGFGYDKDPRIAEIRTERNPEQDMLIIFDCTREQIAQVPNEINKNTKAYLGKLEPGIFQKLPENLEHIYTSFPDKKIRREDIEIGGKSSKELIAELQQNNINLSDEAKYMLNSREFVPTKNSESLTLVRLSVADLGFTRSATTDQIYYRAKELGLELCPADVGPEYRLKYKDQPKGDWFRIGMKTIVGSGDYPRLFNLGCRDDGLWMLDDWAAPGDGWIPDHQFVFCLRKSES